MNLASEIIQKNLNNNPQKAAIGFQKKEEWKELSWQKLAHLVVKTANALLHNRVTKGDRVAIFSDNSAEWMVFDLAILSIGAVSVPLYATSTSQQVHYILEETQAKVILVGNQYQYDIANEFAMQSDHLSHIFVSKKAVWIKKEKSSYLEDAIAKMPDKIEFVDTDSSEIATLIYTSGTTGEPKGVILTHDCFFNTFSAHQTYFSFTQLEKEISLAFLPLTHIFERSWSLFCLYSGAKVFILDQPKKIAKTLLEVKPTMMCAVPRFYQKIFAEVHSTINNAHPFKKKIINWSLEVGSRNATLLRQNKTPTITLKIQKHLANVLFFSKIKKKLGGNLWFMPCGGASISTEVTQFFEAIGLPITVGYGLTETTATLTAFPYPSAIHGSCGKPLPGVEIKIGEEDEILVKGKSIMKGYYNKPEHTQFVFSNGWLKTGDAGRMDPDGTLYITDRIKDLMKTSNGKYIAPQPIESALTNAKAIDQVMIIAEGKKYVSALVVPNFDFLEEYLKKNNIPFTDWSEILKLKEIEVLYEDTIQHCLAHFSDFEKVKKFTLLPTAFDLEKGEITPTLKLKRAVISTKYAAIIEEMNG